MFEKDVVDVLIDIYRYSSVYVCVCVVVGGAIRRSNPRGYFAQGDAELVRSRGTKFGDIGNPAWGRRDTWLARREVRV